MRQDFTRKQNKVVSKDENCLKKKARKDENC